MKKYVILAEKPFISFQGEGKNQGRHSLFIRFLECNLRCEFCDTKYTWTKLNKNLNNKYFKISYKSLSSLISKVDNIVITGGEPLLPQNLIIIQNLLNDFNYKSFEIETNGSCWDEVFFNNLYNIIKEKNINLLFCISPKHNIKQVKVFENLINQYKKESNIFMENILNFFKKIKIDNPNSNIDYIIKFILEKDSDKTFIKNFIKKYKIPTQKIYIQNAGITEETLKTLYKKYANWIKNNKFNYSIRQHIFINEK